jgi:hypothetical protein
MTGPVTEAVLLAAWGAGLRDREGWDRWHSRPRWREAEEWAVDRGLAGNGLWTYRIEFFLVDAPFARVYRLAISEDRHLVIDPVTRQAALADPVDVMLDGLPPPELLDAGSE